MKRLAVLALLMCAAPGVAHAGQATLLHRSSDDTVTSGMIINGPTTAASYRAGNRWRVYTDGQSRDLPADTAAVDNVWLTGNGGAFYRTGQGELAYSGDDGDRVVLSVGDPCPDDPDATIQFLLGPYVNQLDTAHIGVDCTTVDGVYQIDASGGLTTVVLDGAAVAGFAEATGQPGYGRSRSGGGVGAPS